MSDAFSYQQWELPSQQFDYVKNPATYNSIIDDYRRVENPPYALDDMAFPFDTNFPIPTPEQRQTARDGDVSSQVMLIQLENRVNFVGELMRRGLGVIPGDEVKAADIHGKELSDYLPFYRHPDCTRSDSNELYEIVHVINGGFTPYSYDRATGSFAPTIKAVSPQQIGTMIDEALRQPELAHLQTIVDKHIEKVTTRASIGRFVPLPSVEEIDTDIDL